MTDVVITEFMDMTAVDGLAKDFDVIYDPTLVDEPERLSASIGGARALIVRNRTKVDAALLDKGGSLRVIGRLGVGLDNIDLDSCAERDIAVRPAKGANSNAVAEYVIASTLLLVRGAFMSSDDVISGLWPRTALVGREVAGSTMGLIGFGDIARRVATMATALGMHVIAHDPFVDEVDAAWSQAERVPLDDVFARSDVVSVHVPLTETTRNMIGEEALEAMRPTASIINTSRGGIVDERALVRALGSGSIAGAMLDVFAIEPVSRERGESYNGVPGLILTPHVAGVTQESNVRVSAMVAQAVREVLVGSGP
jgi:(S)-sulfolactate dehydrogenase